MGGTHIDGVFIDKGTIVKSAKLAISKSDTKALVLDVIESLTSSIDKGLIQRINLSTTISTNAIVEDRTYPVDVIVQEGPGISNDFSYLNTSIYKISGYSDHRGILVSDIDRKELDQIRDDRARTGSNLAIVTKFSPRYPLSELKIKEYMEDLYDHTILGHSISSDLNFPRRVNTSFLSASVYQIFQEFADAISAAKSSLGLDCPIYVLKADGGTMPLDDAKRTPAETILSGPAASYMGALALSPFADDGILIDIGGSTCDFFVFVDGSPLFEPSGTQIKEFKTLVRAIYSSSIALGGDSPLMIESGRPALGDKRLGPAMAFGGHRLTLSDCFYYLGHMGPIDSIIKENIHKSLEPMAKDLSMGVEDLALSYIDLASLKIKNQIEDIKDMVNSKPLTTVKEVLEYRKFTPKEVKLIGGPAQAFGPFIQDQLGIDTKVLKSYHIANAIGAALARPSLYLDLHADTKSHKVSIPKLGVYENITSSYSLDEAKFRLGQILESKAEDLGIKDPDIEFTHASSFNMVDGYSFGKNIRVQAQLKPGLIVGLGDDHNEG